MKNTGLKINAAVIVIIAVLAIAAVVTAVIMFSPGQSSAKPAETSSADSAPVQQSGYTSVDELSDKTVGVIKGSIYESLISSKMPGAQVVCFDTADDMSAAVINESIDAFVCSMMQARAFIAETDTLKIVIGFPYKDDIAFAFPKNEKGEGLRDEFNEYLAKINADGSYDKLRDKWFNCSDNKVDIFAIDKPKGTLKMATTGTTEPYTFMSNGSLVGLDIDLAAGFCHEYNYDLEINVMEFSAIIPGLDSGEYDFAGANITITNERSELVYFSDSYNSNEVAFVVRK